MRSPVSDSRELIRHFNEARVESLMLGGDLDALDSYLAGPGLNSRNSNDQTVLMQAAIEHNLLVLAHLLSVGADPTLQDVADRTALHHAAIAGNDAGVELLIDAGAQIDARDHDNRTPLWHAAAVHLPDSAVVDVLLRAGANPKLRDVRGVSPEDLL